MPENHTRPPPQGPRYELIGLRLEIFPDMRVEDFAAAILGITRLHMTNIEQGRRRPSLELALKWLAALGPKARLDMFGPMPTVEKRLALLRRFEQLTRKAA